MKTKVFSGIKEKFKHLGEVSLKAVEAIQKENYSELDELLWKAVDLKDRINDDVVEALIRYQPLARDMRFVRSVFTASYDTYRIVRHCSRIGFMLTFEDSVKAVATGGLSVIQPWLKRGIEAFTYGKLPLISDLPFFKTEFDEFWNSHINSKDPYTMAVLVHCEGIFNHTKHLLRGAIYYLEGSRGLEKAPILMVD